MANPKQDLTSLSKILTTELAGTSDAQASIAVAPLTSDPITLSEEELAAFSAPVSTIGESNDSQHAVHGTGSNDLPATADEVQPISTDDIIAEMRNDPGLQKKEEANPPPEKPLDFGSEDIPGLAEVKTSTKISSRSSAPTAEAVINLTTENTPEFTPTIYSPETSSEISQETSIETPAAVTSALPEVREFAENLAIGQPMVDALPAFSILLKFSNQNQKIRTAIKHLLSENDFGIRYEDIEIQVNQGKLLIPQISEYAAIHIAQKLREEADEIQMGLANEVFQAESLKDTTDTHAYIDSNTERNSIQETAEYNPDYPTAESLLCTTENEIPGHTVTKTLSIVIASKLTDEATAKSTQTEIFQKILEDLQTELKARAFKLFAHAITNFHYELHLLGTKETTNRPIRVIATGSAVRLSK